MMFQATPFDLCLFTGVGIAADDPDTPPALAARNMLKWCSERFIETNQRLNKNHALQGCRLALPMTEALFTALQNTPSWQAVSGRAALREHKASVLSFLMSNRENGGSPIWYLEQDNENIYSVLAPADFFTPDTALGLQESWSESTGSCGFDHVRASAPDESARVISTWVVSPGRGPRSAQIEMQAQPIQPGLHQEQRDLPMLSVPVESPDDNKQIDAWPWERLVRLALWQDERLPFYGPSGPFGFQPPAEAGWRPGQRLPSAPGAVHGYLDALGGVWQWEGGRATINRPLGGHWNVQLVGPAYLAWQTHLGDCLGQNVELLSYLSILRWMATSWIGRFGFGEIEDSLCQKDCGFGM